MSTSDSSTSARRDGSARDAVEIAAAMAWLEDTLESVDQFPDHFRMATPELGHLRAIKAALFAPHIPGMVEVDSEPHVDAGDAALLTVWRGDDRDETNHWFAAVTK